MTGGGLGELSGVLAFFVSTGLLPSLAVGVVLSVVVTWIARRRGRTQASGGLVFAAVLSVAGILVFTLMREGVLVLQAVGAGAPLEPPGWRGLRRWSPESWWRASADPLGSTQVLLNIALFVPAGMAWTFLTRRPWGVLAGLVALSVSIEVVQAVTGLGANDATDILANTAGAAVGITAAVVTGWVLDEVLGRRAGWQRWLIRGGALFAAGVLLATLPALIASQRQALFIEEVTTRFAGTTVTDVERWEAEDQLGDRVWWAVPSVYADGFLLDGESATVRYPASFLGAQRCILITWRAEGMSVEPHTGEVCERAGL